jgi:hypothetical protein
LRFRFLAHALSHSPDGTLFPSFSHCQVSFGRSRLTYSCITNDRHTSVRLSNFIIRQLRTEV